jgi:hypothetical protein
VLAKSLFLDGRRSNFDIHVQMFWYRRYLIDCYRKYLNNNTFLYSHQCYRYLPKLYRFRSSHVYPCVGTVSSIVGLVISVCRHEHMYTSARVTTSQARDKVPAMWYLGSDACFTYNHCRRYSLKLYVYRSLHACAGSEMVRAKTSV